MPAESLQKAQVRLRVPDTVTPILLKSLGAYVKNKGETYTFRVIGCVTCKRSAGQTKNGLQNLHELFAELDDP
eukprot:6437163-Amphidinium_carterae.2